MKYTDSIYGQLNIEEPVIVELLACEPVQRLKEVNQYGASFYRFPHLTTSRFEHSVGVYFVLHYFHAPLIEQVAGLLHDLPHTAFSHVSDIIFSDVSQTFHEKFHEKIIFESNIPQILKKHGLSIWELFNKKAFTLAERDLPDLCADRIDYFFRDCVIDKQIEHSDALRLFHDMIVFDGDIVFQTQSCAEQFTATYRLANEKLWAHPLQSALYYLLAQAMKLALEDGVLTFNDLFTTDQAVYNKMKYSKHKEIKKYLTDMEHITIEENPQNYDYVIQPKVRVVDPFVLVKNESVQQKIRLSTRSSTVKQANDMCTERMRKGYYVKVIQ